MKRWILSAAALLAALALGGIAQAAEPACSSYTPAIVGGPVPGKSSSIVVLRWLGNANYEVDYQGHVFLFGAFLRRCLFEQRDAMSRLRESGGERHAEHAAADDGDARHSPATLLASRTGSHRARAAWWSGGRRWRR